MSIENAIIRGEQPDLLPDAGDEALLFSEYERSKRCTGEQSKAIQGKRGLIELCLSWQVPVKIIRERSGVSEHIIQVIGQQLAEQVATDTKRYSEQLLRWSARCFALFQMKAHEAEPHTLAVAGGIMATHGRELSLMGEIGGEKVVKEATDELAVCAQIRAMLKPVDSASADTTVPVNILRNDHQSDSPHGSHGPDAEPVGAAGLEREGGGVEALAASENADGTAPRGFCGKSPKEVSNVS